MAESRQAPFEPGTPVWWRDQLPGSYGAFRQVGAVFLTMRGSRAGIAVQMRSGEWAPKTVRLSSLTKRESGG